MRFLLISVVLLLIVLSSAVMADDVLFDVRRDYGTGDMPISFVSADFNADGDDDLAITCWGRSIVLIHINNGDGTFQAAVEYRAGANPYSIFAIDLDADGDNDLAVTNSKSDNISILLNQSDKVATFVDGESGSVLPVGLKLTQNYPNPFNPTTRIEYYLPRHSHVTIIVFNLLGQKVRTLVDRDISAGSYIVTWNGTDAGGRAVATGVYLYRIQAGDYVETKKMLLLK